MNDKQAGCPYDPSPLVGIALGMFHCPECGCMILAGMKHGVCDEDMCDYGIFIDYSEALGD